MPFAPAAALILVAASGTVHAQPVSAAPPASAASAVAGPARQLPTVEIRGHYDNAVGTTDAASAGTVTSKLIEARPALRPAEVLEFVPGVIVTQHSGDGKANQYFLRGFNLDHGTDFATFVDGMPVNMPTHAHGHGYSDLNFLIPELVRRIGYRKGPYDAEGGDFASAGSARIDLVDALPSGLATVTLGQDRYGRALVANSNRLGEAGGQILYALEYAHNNGPWDHEEHFHRVNGLLRYSLGDASSGLGHVSLTASQYSASWNSTDQIPRRAVRDGTLDRFGAIDDSDGGRTARTSLSLRGQRDFADGELRFDAYAIRSRLNLFSNFTYFLDNPDDGDQFEQAERRQVYGLATSRTWRSTWAGLEMANTVGLQMRHDRLSPVGLYDTVRRQRTSTTQESRVRETSAALWLENDTRWTRWFRSVVGLRGDRYSFDVDSSIDANSGKEKAGLVSPKLSLVFGPWVKTEFFVNYGNGFHSNDARGTTATVPAKGGTLAGSVTPLARSKGGELGLRTEVVPGLQTSVALWKLKLASELIFVGDAGETEASRASRRSGIEINNHWRATSWLLVDADFAASRARFVGDPENVGRHIPGAIDKVFSGGVTVEDLGPWFGHFQLRYFGPRPLVEDDSQRSKATTLAYLRVGYKATPSLRLALDVFNLFGKKASDIDYYYTSRLQGEPAGGVDDVHFHPVEPRRVRLTLNANF